MLDHPKDLSADVFEISERFVVEDLILAPDEAKSELSSGLLSFST